MPGKQSPLEEDSKDPRQHWDCEETDVGFPEGHQQRASQQDLTVGFLQMSRGLWF